MCRCGISIVVLVNEISCNRAALTGGGVMEITTAPYNVPVHIRGFGAMIRGR